MVERLQQSDEQLLAEAAVKAQGLAEQLRADAAELRAAERDSAEASATEEAAEAVSATADAADELARALAASIPADAPLTSPKRTS